MRVIIIYKYACTMTAAYKHLRNAKYKKNLIYIANIC